MYVGVAKANWKSLDEAAAPQNFMSAPRALLLLLFWMAAFLRPF